jgi:hypothetical protein
MALQKTVTFKGINILNCYIKIWRIEGGKDFISFNVSYSSNSTEEAFNGETYSCAYNINGSNPIAQAYEHLKTLPEFAGATDC